MAVKIRLQRHGKKNFAFFDIVVAVLNADRALAWLNVGAEPTLVCRRILSYEGVLLRKHLNGGIAKGALTQEQADAKWNAWKAERDAKIAAKKSNLANAAIEAKKAAKAEETKVKEARAEAIAKKAAELAAKQAEAVAEEAPAEEAAEAPAEEA